MGNMVLGFIAIIISSKATGLTETTAIAGMLIFLASLCDVSDGALARALGVESQIGKELDSFADAVSYGVAPAVIAYQAYFYNFPELFFSIDLGMIIALTFPVFAIFRLARFNIGDEKGGFTGLPSPAAGIVIASIPALPFVNSPIFDFSKFAIPLNAFVVIYLLIGYMMVSKIDYGKVFSDIWGKGKVAVIMVGVVSFSLMFFFRMFSVFAVTGLYIVYGIISFFVKKVRK